MIPIMFLVLPAWEPVNTAASTFLLAGALMSSVVLRRAEPIQQPPTSLEPGRHGKLQPTAYCSRVLIVGAGAVGRQLAESLEASGHYRVVGFIDDDIVRIGNGKWRILGRRQMAAAIVREHAVDAVYLAYTPTWQQELAERLTADCPEV